MSKKDDLLARALRVDTDQALPIDDKETTIRRLIDSGWRPDPDRGKAGGQRRGEQQSINVVLRRGLVLQAFFQVPKGPRSHRTSDTFLAMLKAKYDAVLEDMVRRHPNREQYLLSRSFKVGKETLRNDVAALARQIESVERERSLQDV